MQINDLIKFTTLSARDLLQIEYSQREPIVHLEAAVDWLCLAQDKSKDQGVSAYYSLSGWAPSFIETTGYIIETFLAADRYFPNKNLFNRALQMGNFIISMQLPVGGYRTYTPEHKPESKPIIFNTGQDILGMVALYKACKKKKYIVSAQMAANFLCDVQNSDGSWTLYEVDFKPHTYHSRVAYALIQLGLINNNQKYITAGRKNLDWVVSQQLENGWFNNSYLPGLSEKKPITHTISYTLEGLLYSGQMLESKKYLRAAILGIESLLRIFTKDDELYATYSESWKPCSKYVCLTGNAQISILWFEMHSLSKNEKYLQAALRMNSLLKKYQNTSGNNSAFRGGLKGCHPIYGTILENRGYCRCSFINWGTKFFCDAILQELNVT